MPFINNLGWHRGLDRRFAMLAGPFAADVALHGELTRHIIQLFTGVFAYALELAATAALSVFRFMVGQSARQFGRQRCAILKMAWVPSLWLQNRDYAGGAKVALEPARPTVRPLIAVDRRARLRPSGAYRNSICKHPL